MYSKMNIYLKHKDGHDYGERITIILIDICCDKDFEYIRDKDGDIYKRYLCYCPHSPYGWEKDNKVVWFEKRR